MAIDADIVLKGAPVYDPTDSVRKATTLREMNNQATAVALANNESQRQSTMKDAIAASVDPATGTPDPTKVMSAYYGAGDMAGATTYAANQRAAQAIPIEGAAVSAGLTGGPNSPEYKAAITKLASVNPDIARQTHSWVQTATDTQINQGAAHLSKVNQILGSAVDEPSYQAARQQAQAAGLDVSNAPQHYDPAAVTALRNTNLTAEQAIKAAQDDRKQAFEERKPIVVAQGSSAISPSGGVVYDADNPTGATMPTDVPGISARIAQVEGTAKNPKSSASGVGQFTDGTFVDTFRKTYPQSAGLTDQQILARRGTGVEQQMLPTLTASNATALQSAGIQPTAPNVYAAHFLGVGDASRVLKAPPATPLPSLLSPQVIAANPQLANMNVGQFQQWTASKMTPGAGPTVGGLSKSTLDNEAYFAMANGGNVSARFGRNGYTARAIANNMSDIMDRLGLTPADIIAGSAQVKAGVASLAKLEAVKAPIMAFSNTFDANAEQLKGLLATGTSRTGVPVINAWLQNGRRAITGDPAVSEFDTALRTVAGEFGKINVGAGGQVTDSARGEISQLLNASQTPQQILAVLNRMKIDTDNRRAGFAKQEASIVAQIKGGATPGTQTADATPAPATPPAASFTHTAIDAKGNRVGFDGTRWVALGRAR